MEYTKGPWKWEDSALVDSNGYEVIGIFPAHGEHKAWLTVNAGGEDDGGNQTLIQYAPAMYEALKKLEWLDSSHKFAFMCPACHQYQHNGHKPNCYLAQAIKRAEGRP